MEKPIVCFMKERIKQQNVDVDRLVRENPQEAIDYIHGQYRLAVAAFREQVGQS